MSKNPNDLQTLNPAHFLIGRSITMLSRHLYHCNKRLIFSIFNQNHFWERWSNEYLYELKHRRKGTSEVTISIGSLFLLKVENSLKVWSYNGAAGQVDLIHVISVMTRLIRGVSSPTWTWKETIKWRWYVQFNLVVNYYPLIEINNSRLFITCVISFNTWICYFERKSFKGSCLNYSILGSNSKNVLFLYCNHKML